MVSQPLNVMPCVHMGSKLKYSNRFLPPPDRFGDLGELEDPVCIED